MEVKLYKTIEREDMEKSVAEFLKELEETVSEGPSGWKLAVEKKNLVVARKRTPNTDVYRLRMVGHLLYPVDVVDAVLNTDLRLKWDKGITSIETLEQLENGLTVVYISTNAPPGISNRDFLHLRVQNNNTDDKGTKIILDKSVTHPSKPNVKGYIRAITIFSGLVLSSKQIQEGGKIIDVTQYAAISQVDVCGELPKLFINAVTAKGTADWFVNLDKACAAYTAGKLGVKA